MIFALAKDEPTLFVFLSERDVTDMRSGKTKFVDEGHLMNRPFKKVVFCVNKSDQASYDMLKEAGCIQPDTEVSLRKTKTGEKICGGCKGVMSAGALFEGMCIVCWRERARKKDE
jgi:hypothetical protein